MIFNLVHRLSSNAFFLRRATPYNIDDIFKAGIPVSTQDKKQFCVMLDLIRSLIIRSQIQLNKQELVVFGNRYADFDEELFLELMASRVGLQSDYLNFIYSKIGDAQKLKTSLTLLDEHKLAELYEYKKG